VSERDVSLEHVGTAEDVLRRLIHERKMLESAADVLKTYREVKSQLQNATEELGVVVSKVEEVKAEIVSIEMKRNVVFEKVEREIRAYEEERRNKVESDLAEVHRGLADVVAQYTQAVQDVDDAKVEYDSLIKEKERELSKVEEQLTLLKSEHVALAEAISRAMTMFKPQG